MKRARRIRPKNPLAMAPIMKKGGAHARRDKRAARARQKAALRKLSAREESE
ncbi:MAG: hypothetical protein Q7U32_02750 [Rhodocyclaceae bacterium]|jgi:hypothetical protein|nr:hypothetical protein [Rhodocyclaceae bacterium]